VRFAWIFGASVVLHGGLVIVLPSVRAKVHPKTVTVIEVAELPEPPPPPPPPPPEIVHTREASPPKVAPPPRAPEIVHPREASPSVDLSGTLVAADGIGVAVTTSAPVETAIPTAAPAPPPPPPPVSTIVPLSDLSKPPRAPALDRALEHNYPPDARRAGVSGRAVLRVEIRADGGVGRVDRVSESYAGFAEACERTVRSARWEPPIDRQGSPVATRITYTCKFEVRS
jgi:protein TonB